MWRKQKSNFRAFHHTISSIDLNKLSEKWEIEDTLKNIQSRWSVIDSLHWEIDSETVVANSEYEQTFLKYEALFNSTKKDLNIKMGSVRHREKSTPQLDIPCFLGNYHQWVSFKDLYVESIHSNRSLSDAQKMQFLKSKLRGEAEKLVQHLHITSDNYQTCWEILNHRYNNIKLIFSSHANILMNLPNIQHPLASHIKRMHDTTKECLYAIKNLNVDISTWDPLIVHILAQKLDSDTHNEYIQTLENPRDLQTLKDFLGFLENKFTSLEASNRKQEPSKPFIKHQESSSSSYKKFPSFKSVSNNKNNMPCRSFTQSVIKPTCPMCNQIHKLFACSDFLKLQPIERKNMVAKWKLCINCLFDHNGVECFSEKRCRECEGRHNTLLHQAFVKPSTSETESRKHVTHVTRDSSSSLAEVLLATAQIKIQKADGSYHVMRALIDQGSQTSLITENGAQILGLPRQRCKGTIFGVGSKSNNCKGVINITCQSTNSDYTFKTDVFIMRNLINNLPNYSFPKPSWQFLESIQLADPDFHISRPIDLLLGADVYSSIIMSGIIKEEESLPIAQQSRLGWFLCGKLKSFQCNVIRNNVADLQRFWSIEDIEESSSMSEEDLQCLQQYQTTTTRNEEGRYVVRLPVHKDAEEKLGDSKKKAVAQFYQLEKKFQNNSNIADNYKSFISEYIELGHMLISDGKLPPSNYLPHHPIQKPDSTTTALRVVFNASSKTSSGYSLNDVMYCGPNLQQDLLQLILQWRTYQYALTADIEKMFRQILLDGRDQHFQKIMWRNFPWEALREYQLATVTYGTKAAPFLAMMTLKQLASDEGHKFPKSPAAKVLKEQFYMDDLLSGSHSLQSAKQLQSDLIALLKLGGFNLRKWSSNKPELCDMSTVPQNQKAFDFRHQQSTKTLGLRWSPQSDQFEFELKIDTSAKHSTKRELLSDISKIFDPLGWLSPVSTKLKILFQTVWLHDELGWDDKLPENINTEWNKIKADLKHINNIQVPRWLETGEGEDIILHGFCDASIKAYSCVIYCKISKKDQHQSIILVAAKARLVSPNKNVSLPRLELSGALLLTKLMEKVHTCMKEHNITTYGWCDSTAVLGWLQGDPNRWRSFVANRVSKIIKIIPATHWRYVKSAENPADCASRGVSAEQLKHHPLWWNGPSWLASSIDHEPPPIFDTKEELKRIQQVKQANVTITTSYTCDDVIDRLIKSNSSWARVTRVLAWILRAGSRDRCTCPYLTIYELRRAKYFIVKYLQQTEFAKEIDEIRNNKQVHSKSKLLPLNPFLDKDGLLRVGGRLKNANISQNMIHPIIIPHSSHLTDLLIDHAHKLTFHGGARVTLALLRQQYWILGGNRAVKKRLRTCIKCRRHNPTHLHQAMGVLPEARVTSPTRCFFRTGVDYTGYVNVKSSKGRGVKSTKGYVAVFVCMVTKAVHLELVSDLTSSAFLAALRRMSARRGAPRHIYSDNGTNFVGANNILQKKFFDLSAIINEDLLSEISMMNIEWHFIAPTWASAGGLWEAAVKSLKYHLKRVIGEQKLTYEEFSTLLTQLEACLNSRPLCALTEDPEDLEYLTPSHFLASGPILNIIETERDQRTRWQLTQKIFGDIWKRWNSEYLTQLNTRSKWQRQQPNMKVDDVVLIHDINLPAGKWAMGKVIDAHPGADGLVRVVTLKTKNGNIKRPITMLSPLLRSDEVKHDQQKNNTNSDIHAESSTEIKYRPIRKCRRPLNLYTMMIMLLSMVVSSVNAISPYNITSLKANQTLYFDKISNMYLIRDHWNLIVYYDMAPYWQSTDLYNKYVTHLDDMCSRAKGITQCNVILLQLRHNYVELQHYNDMLLGQRFGAHTRLRRGLINGIGYVANSLFGILEQSFADQYQKDIELIRANQKHIASLWRNQTSVVEAQYNLLKRVEDNMEKQYKVFNQHLNRLQSATNTLKEEVQREADINEFTMSAIIANGLIAHLKNIQNSLLDTIADIYHGEFDIHLITPNQLREELSIISGQLSKELALPISNIQTDLIKIYHLLKVKARVTEDYLIFEIKIPLVSRESYEVYATIPIPQKINNNMITITPIADHLAINIQRDTFVRMSENEYHSCLPYDEDTRLCVLTSPIYQKNSDINFCHKDQHYKQCAYKGEVCRNIWQQLSNKNAYIYFCCEQCTVRLICGHRVTIEQVNNAGIISLGHECIMKGDTFTVYSHKEQFQEMHTQPDIVAIQIPPINHVINLSVPISKLEPDFKDDRIKLEHIGGQITRMKEENPEIESISYHDIHHYVVTYLLLSAALIAGLACAWRVRRARLRRAARMLRTDVIESVSGSVEYRVIKAEQSNVRSSNESENQYASVSERPKPALRVLNKASSPILTKFDFSELGHS